MLALVVRSRRGSATLCQTVRLSPRVFLVGDGVGDKVKALIELVEIRHVLVHRVTDVPPELSKRLEAYFPEVEAVVADSAYRTPWIAKKIIDDGIGIPKEDLDKIYERFYRVDKARTREMGGTGLGLSIAKEILDQNDSMIDIKSDLGKGTEVVIRIPTKQGKNNKDINTEE